ncbi:tyrosine-type recombinase/integrase [Odoribacter lunatus]|uniref:tyrosine-type recombinase/integrase n=1 Tax=Odoribacter lunatus TaxID=2941335 RepID=UPI00203B4D8D|nr:site-specific integrase [Odoribacter lunatus]
MASIKVKFRPSSVSGKEGCIYYQIIQSRTVRQLGTNYRIYAEEWNKVQGTVFINTASPERYHYLLSVREWIQRDLRRFEKILKSNCSVDEIVRKLQNLVKEESFLAFMERVIVQLKHLNRERTAETYKATFRSFFRFHSEKDILLDEMTSDLMQEYEAYLKLRGIAMNTISFYMRILRAVYNRAVEKGMAEQRYPFKHVYTGIDKTIKRALTLKDIRQIKDLNLALHPVLDFARDMFLFSFYTRGMSFIDMAYLRKSDVKNGVLIYRRRKTGQQLSIKWERCMQEVVDKYDIVVPSASPYLLPIITVTDAQRARQQYKNKLYSVNLNLKRVAARIRLPIPLTTYVARHSWASIARNKNIPLSVISEGMGHDSEMTTQIYLASLECSVIDNANALILKDL